MRRALVVPAFALLLIVALRRDAASQSNLVHEIAPGVYFRDAEPDKQIIANTGWVVFRDYVLVIDANFPWGARAVLNDLRSFAVWLVLEEPITVHGVARSTDENTAEKTLMSLKERLGEGKGVNGCRVAGQHL